MSKQADRLYQKFLRLGLSLGAVGIEGRTENYPYFCTPRGASILGWAGADGIHYCRICGFGDMIFAVSPMNAAPDYVHPIAENFEALLRLLLACGDAAALEQAWQWDEETFNRFLLENPPTEEAASLLSQIAKRLSLRPMEHPWAYLHRLQRDFDYSKIKYTEDFFDPDMNPAAAAAPEWKVYFDGSFWSHHGQGRPGREIRLNTEFDWAGRHWMIPAAYSCGKGLVMDFCMRVEADEIRSFMEKWGLDWEHDSCEQFTKEQQMELELDNPLCMNFDSGLTLNGRILRSSHGCSTCFNPCLPDDVSGELEAQQAMEHYGLDDSCGWVICRNAFPWQSKRKPEIKTLSLTMTQQPERIPGPHFKPHGPGDTFRFVHPVSQIEYTLTVKELERQTLPKDSFRSDRWSYPNHFTSMVYTISPEISERITVSDCDDGDRPVKIAPENQPFAPTASSDACAVGIIGGADGPTVLMLGSRGEGTLHTACSALRFAPTDKDIEWRITFHEKRFDDLTLDILG